MKDPIEDIPDNEPPEFDPDFDLPDNEPPDGYDKAEGYPVDVEDIAIVAWEAVRALRLTQGAASGHSWMHTPKPDQRRMIKIVQAVQAETDGHICDNPEHRLVAAVVKALA
jgi:hypothetical protein